MPTDLRIYAFIHALLGGERAEYQGGHYVLADGRSLPQREVGRIARAGGIDLDAAGCTANSGTREWLQRARSADAGAERKLGTADLNGLQVNRNESSLTRLVTTDPEFLAPHQIASGERLRRLYERAQMQPRTTSSYTDRSVRGRPTSAGATDLPNSAIDARRELARLHTQIPRESLAVAIAFCGELRGLQEIERQCELPRRAGRFVLRIALEQLALFWGLSPMPAPTSRSRNWMETGVRPQLTT